MARKQVIYITEKKKKGCGHYILILLLIIIIAGVFGGNSASDSQAPQPTANDKVSTTQTGNVSSALTATPTATPTAKTTQIPATKSEVTPVAIPDATTMNATQAAQALAEYYSEGMHITEVEKTNDYISVTMHADSYFTRNAFVRSCCRIMLNVSEHLFQNDGFESLHMKFTVPGRDKYGNETTVTGMTISLYRETAAKINYEYMRSNLGVTTKGFLQITDAYFAHPDMLDSVY